MVRLITLILLISPLSTFSQVQENKPRHKYDVNFEYFLPSDFLDYDNYLFGKIKTIKYEKSIYENANESNGLSLIQRYITYYNKKEKLTKIETFSTSRILNFTTINFGKGFDFWLNSKNDIEIDSVSKTIKSFDSENGSQTTSYILDSNYKVKSVINIIKDSSKLYYYKEYDKNMLTSEIYRADSKFYTWDESKRLKHYERRNNSNKFIPNFKQAPDFTLDFQYINDTIFLIENPGNILRQYKSFDKNNIILPIYEKNIAGITKTYFYTKNYSLYKMIYFFNQDNTKLIYSYELDKYGNWIKRFDNKKESYLRKLKYDKNRNWISSETYEYGHKSEKIDREIIYYE